MTEPPARPMELLQMSTTVTAIALALAALLEGKGPVSHNGIEILPAILLISGLAGIVGGIFAGIEMRAQYDVLPDALLFTLGPLIAIGIVEFIFLIGDVSGQW